MEKLDLYDLQKKGNDILFNKLNSVSKGFKARLIRRIYELGFPYVIYPWLHKVSKFIYDYNIRDVLDIGANDNLLKSFLNDNVRYQTVDIRYKPTYKIDLFKTSNLPIKDGDYQCVVLSNILEHLPNYQDILKEALRITRKYVIITLPNDLHLQKRINFLLGYNMSPLTDKYGHKGICSLKDSYDIIKGLDVIEEYDICTYYNYIPEFFHNLLIKVRPTLFVSNVCVIINNSKIIK